MSVLEASGISAGYGGADIVHEVSMHVDAGEIATIIGPNGAGKSTMLKAIFGLLRPGAGTVVIDGVDVTGIAPSKLVAAGASFVPQTDNVFASLSIRENLQMGGYRRSEGVDRRIDEVLDLFPDLRSRPRERASRLSGGQRQAPAIGRALMLDPKLLLLDEPTASLSPVMREQVLKRVVEIKESGVAVLMVEQNAKEALAISDRGYVMVAGRIELEQSGAEMIANEDVGRLFLGQEPPAPARPRSRDPEGR